MKTVPVLHHRARILRRNQTDAEAKLWACLRAGKFGDFRFRRQFPIANFIADFACPRAKLVIELDGGQHLEQAAKDAWRTRLIEVRGYRVIRFWDHEVLIEIDAALERIYEELRGVDPASLHHD